MNSLPLEQLPDPDLVDAVRNPATPRDRQTVAFNTLEQRHRPLLLHILKTRVRSQGSFLSAVGRGTIGEVIADVMGQAIRGFRNDGGAAFKTYVIKVLQNEIVNGFRKPAKFITGLDDGDGDRKREPEAKRTIAPGSMAHLALVEAVDLGRACLAALSERHRKIFIWGVVADFSGDQLHDLFPEYTLENLRKIKSRAIVDFLAEWERLGGPKLELTLELAGPAMAEHLDPDKITDAKAREAYRAWLVSGLAGAAKALKRSPEETRKLLLSAAHDLYRQVAVRGRKSARARAAVLAQVLEMGEGSASADALLAQARRTIDVVRAAFGFAPMETAVHTLGSFLQERLRTAADYRGAQKALGLTAAEMRRLLANELDPAKDLLSRIASFTDTPAARLRALPRRPLEEPQVALRGSEEIDPDRVRERALRWLRPGR